MCFFDAEPFGDANRSIVELGEKLYNGDLKLDEDTTDVFGRPARTWSYEGEEIGTFAQKELLAAEFTTAVTGKELYDVVGKTAYDKYDFESYVDGKENDFYKEIARNNRGDIDETGNGALTQVFVDTDNEIVTATIINTYLAQATSDYNEKKDTVNFEVYGLSGEKGTVSGEDFDIVDVEKDDFVLVTYSYHSEAIESIDDVEIISDVEISRFTSDDKGDDKGTKVSSVTAEGTKYDASEKLDYEENTLKDYTKDNLKDSTYNIYLDQYGYAIGVELVDGVDNYVFITGIDTGSSNLVTKNYEANAIFMDGTSSVIDVKNNDDINDALEATKTDGATNLNTWFKYTVNSSNVYTLSTIPTKITKDVAQSHTSYAEKSTIDDRNISLESKDGKIYGNDDSVYLLAELDVVTKGSDKFAVIKGVDEVSVGIDNVSIDVWSKSVVADELADKDKNEPVDAKNVGGTFALYDDEGYVIAAVVVGESTGIAQNIVFVHSSKASSESYADGMWTWTRDVIINGEEVELTETNDEDESYLADEMVEGKWYTVKYDADGNVKKVEDFEDDAEYVNKADGGLMKAAELVQKDEDLVVVDVDDVQVVYRNGGKTVFDYSDPTKDTGIRVAADVKIVFQQVTNNRETTDYLEGYDALASVLDELNENDYKYRFAAVIEEGRATSIVIIDDNKDNAHDSPTGSTGDIAVLSLTFDSNSKKFSVSAAGDKVDLPKGTLSMKVEQNGFTVASRTITDFGGRTENEVFAVTSDAAAGVVQANGEYTVTLTLKDSEGNSYTGTFTTTING